MDEDTDTVSPSCFISCMVCKEITKLVTKSFTNTVLVFLIILCVKKFVPRLLILCITKIISDHVLLQATPNICYSNKLLITEGHWIA